MKKHLFRRGVCLLLAVVFLFGSFAVTISADEVRPKGDETTSSDLSKMQALIGTESYDAYLRSFSQEQSGASTVSVNVTEPVAGGSATLVSETDRCVNSRERDQSAWASFDWDVWADRSVYLPTTGSASWNFSVPSAGMYYLKIEYYNPSSEQSSESSISTTERKFYIDDMVPFREVSTISFPKSWVFDSLISTETTEATASDRSSITYETKDDGYYKYVVRVADGKKTTETWQIMQDITGNSMAPGMSQYSKWSTYYLQDNTGYFSGYFQFYFTQATHSITLEAQREPIILRDISLIPISEDLARLESYETFRNRYADKTAPQNGEITVLEAEFPDYVSDSSVYATNDNTSAVTSPVVERSQLYNVIGENSYNMVGQWAAYKFSVNESGMYKLAMRYKQDVLQGMYICRAIKLSGGDYGLPDGTPAAPFAEAYNCQFNYNKKWQSSFVEDNNGTQFEFYFEKGVEYTLYLECSLGTLKESIRRVENTLSALNDCYLRILQLTGSDPDRYRDYNFLGVMPDVLVTLLMQAIELQDVKREFEILCGTNGSHITTLETIARLLDKMGSEDGNDIAANMSNLKSYLGTLGTWINSSKESAMMVDNISICPSDATPKQLPRANAGFFRSIWFEIKSFIYSFVTRYDQMGLTSVPDEGAELIEVWIATGRDQSSIWRSIIDAKDGYTETTGVAVKLKLITGGTLLPSILARKGPDVYIGLGSSDVINYAIREAVLGVSGNDKKLTDEENAIFGQNYYTYKENNEYITTTENRGAQNLTFKTETFSEVLGDYDGDGKLTTEEGANYAQAALDTLTLLDVTYGIPQTMSFAMMFYRMDIFAELGIEVPQTWSQLLALLPVLQTNNMSIGLAYSMAINFLLYQRGGNMWKYTDTSRYDSKYAGAKIGLSEDIALEAFEYTCRLYTDYSFPIAYDAANRFRTGEMPVIIGDYTGVYNQLIVYATEIEGLWEFCSIPGSFRKDGTFNYNSIAGVGATIMPHGCQHLRAAWQFIQWQSSDRVQSNYGNKMVALIGPSAKYEAANVKALNNLSWTAQEKRAIEAQMKHLSSIVNYPGSYIIGRYTSFAFLSAVNDGANPTEAMEQYIDTINAEIKRKREEFDLETFNADEEPPELPQNTD